MPVHSEDSHTYVRIATLKPSCWHPSRKSPITLPLSAPSRAAAEVVEELLVRLVSSRTARDDAAADRGNALAQPRPVVEAAELIGDREAHRLGEADVLSLREREDQALGRIVANAQSHGSLIPSDVRPETGAAASKEDPSQIQI